MKMNRPIRFVVMLYLLVLFQFGCTPFPSKNENETKVPSDRRTATLPNTDFQRMMDLQTPYTPYALDQHIEDLLAQYSSVLSVETIGYSVEERPIRALTLQLPTRQASNKNEDTKIQNRPRILLLGGMHARENYSVVMVMKQLDELLYAYHTDGRFGPYDLKTLLQNVDITFIPTMNPDGMHITHYGIQGFSNASSLEEMKNIPGQFRFWKANARGVDLNKNFDDGNWHLENSYWMSEIPASGGYKGPYPESEPETQALQKFVREKRFLLAISFHSMGEVFYWADTDTHDVFENKDTQIIQKMHSLTGYQIMPISKDPRVFGRGFENWFKKEFQRFAFVIELSPMQKGPYEEPPTNQFDTLVWDKVKYVGAQLATEAMHLEHYDVYQNERFLKTFYSKNRAISFAQQWENGSVLFKETTLWMN